MKPRVGVSACLLGERVRYDGGHKLSQAAVDLDVEWVPVCPEVEMGMPVPREAVALGGVGPRMVGVTSGTDHTDAMRGWAAARIGALGALDGYLLKRGSPSCGLDDVPVRGGDPGTGLFAAALRRLRPDLPLADEAWLEDKARRRAFLDAVLAHLRARSG